MARARTIAIYVRCSTTEQALSGLGLADQLARSRAYIDALGIGEGLPVAVYEDAGESGGSLDRPALAGLREQVRRRSIAAVVVLKLDRLSRSLRDLLELEAECSKVGCGLHSVTERIDTSTPAGKAMFAMLGTFAEFELHMIRDRTRAAIATKRAQGRAHGGERMARLGERFVQGRIEGVAAELAVVTRIMARRADGASLGAIAAELAQDGVPTKRGGRWRACTVQAVVRANGGR